MLESLDNGKFGRLGYTLVDEPVDCLLVLLVDGRRFLQFVDHLVHTVRLDFRMADLGNGKNA
jgi:hypothetical protein